MTKTLSVKPVGSAMVPDYEALAGGAMRFVGRRLEGDAFVPTGEPVTVPFRAEYLQEVKAGTLAVCDADSARLCGVPFAS